MTDPQDAVTRLRAAFRPKEPGYRTLHAKGAFYAGTFTATPEATKLSRAGHLSGQTVPVLVRWSNGGGNPAVADPKPDVRGMAVSWKLPDGTATDLLGQTSPRFPTRDPEEFVALAEASTKPAKLPLFLARRRHLIPALLAGGRAGALKAPASFAEATFYPIHAYAWIAADGTKTWVRYRLQPVATKADRLPERFTGADRLREEIVARLARGPVAFDLVVQVAAPGDDPHDPTSVWKVAREFVAGRITVTEPVDDPEATGGPVVFDPTRIVDGLELSDDPILLFRPGAYSESVERRVAGRH